MVQYLDMKWNIKNKIKGKIEDITLHPIIEQLLLQRDITTKDEVEDFFAPNYDDLHDPFLFQDMERVVKRVEKAINNQEIVGIFGDHDADGVSSATVLADGLEMLGLNVDIYIPDKITEGHGINKTAIDEFVSMGITLMFSVDCGTSNTSEVAYANSKNIDVIITDHHHAPEVLPDAYAIINPQLPSEKYPFKHLSGTAVAFKVIEALFNKILPEKIDQLKWLLDVVCVGTIADCMPLVGENRILVKYGLIVLSKTKRLGYQEMINVGGITINQFSPPSANIVAFQMAPRINAAGRMSHAKYAFELMRETDRVIATKQAQILEQQNLDRREITEKLTTEVEKIVEESHGDKAFILISGTDYPVGIVGIIAGRIAEKYGKPTGIFTKYEDESRGSFRSVEGVHIIDVLNDCSKYLEKFGGHAQAAGATIKNKNFDEFCYDANVCVKKSVGDKMYESCVDVDCEILIEDVSRELSTELQKLEPFGEENEEPIFIIRNLVVADIRAIGSEGNHLKMKLSSKDGSIVYDAIAFGLGYMTEIMSIDDVIDIATHIQENEWMGNISVQFNVVDLKILTS